MKVIIAKNRRIYVHDGVKWHGLHKYAFPPASNELIAWNGWYAFIRGLANNNVEVDGNDVAFISTIYKLDTTHFKLAPLPPPYHRIGECPVCYHKHSPLIRIPCGSKVPHFECRECHFKWYKIALAQHYEGSCSTCRVKWVYPL